jgi:excinuclease ABC subunit A
VKQSSTFAACKMAKQKAPRHKEQDIEIKGARMHNLKGLDVIIPRNKLVVITGLSGSGKSSLAFDTLYAEGQRRYVESLSSYARQFLGKLNKPLVDYIKGISPAIAIEQKVNTRNPRSTVGTSTEIYDYIKLLFARTGKTYSPISGKLVKRHTIKDIIEELMALPNDTQVLLLSDIRADRDRVKHLELMLQQGFTRLWLKGKVQRLDDLLELLRSDKTFAKQFAAAQASDIRLVADRILIDHSDADELRNRIADSVQTALFEGNSCCYAEINGKLHFYSNRFEADGMEFAEPSVHFFTFNNPLGACRTCEGFGSVIGIDKNKVVPNSSLSIYEGAVAPWKGPQMEEWKKYFIKLSSAKNFPIHRPYCDLDEKELKYLWNGEGKWEGIDGFFKYLESQLYKIQYRVMISRYRGKTNCPDCLGTRLRKDAGYVKVGGKSIQEIVLMPVDECLDWFKNLKLSEYEKQVSKRLLTEITNRLGFLCDVGLGYLTLNRLSNTLSGGESQRINLATSLGSSLVGSLYVLDEPSIGLHPTDTQRLIQVLTKLRDIGNTVVVVEHDEDIMRCADQIIDIGPMAGSRGGELVFQGNHEKLKKEKKSLTALYLNGVERIAIPLKRRGFRNFIELTGVNENNLNNLSVKFPLNMLTVITGVSGSGKTTLIKRVLVPALERELGGFSDTGISYARLDGDIKTISSVQMVDQNPIGKSSRSNPVTYIKAYDDIRELYAWQPLARQRAYKPSHFSFNVDGGRCEICQGEGEVTVEMQFMADIHLTCEACQGKRFKADTLDILYLDKNIADLLNMTVDDAIDFFEKSPLFSTAEQKIIQKMQALSDVGLGYIHLGQPSSTLSGGEAQRIKLASFLIKGDTNEKTLFVFDEPTTGLHFHDIKKLLQSFDALLQKGHSIITIEHNPEIIKSADWVIDLGPGGGKHGGNIVFEGTPEQLTASEKSLTGKYLKNKMP